MAVGVDMSLVVPEAVGLEQAQRLTLKSLAEGRDGLSARPWQQACAFTPHTHPCGARGQRERGGGLIARLRPVFGLRYSVYRLTLPLHHQLLALRVALGVQPDKVHAGAETSEVQRH